MKIDIEKLEALAKAATQGDWQVIETELPCRLGRPHVERRIFTTKDHPQLKAPYPVVNGSVALGTDETPVHHMVSMTAEDAAYVAAANPAAVLELITSGKRMASRLMYCPACQGEGEVYSGRNSYEGYNQPPEPIMDKCGECDGDGALGDTAECISILDELETLRAENAGLKTGYEGYERVNAELRAECDALRKDAERYRWLIKNAEEIYFCGCNLYLDPYHEGDDAIKIGADRDVDAVMSKEAAQ